MQVDLLVIAGAASEILERHGFIACGRRENGVARVDFWTRDGICFRHVLTENDVTAEDVVAACLSIAESAAPSPSPLRSSPLN